MCKKIFSSVYKWIIFNDHVTFTTICVFSPIFPNVSYMLNSTASCYQLFFFSVSLLFFFSAFALGLNVSAPLADDNMTLLVSDKKTENTALEFLLFLHVKVAIK